MTTGTTAPPYERVTQGDVSALVVHGEIDGDAVLPRARLFAELRAHGITNLGRVERASLEINRLRERMVGMRA